MSKTPNFDLKVKQILDSTQPGERVCELTGERWEMTEKDVELYKKFNVPPQAISQQTFFKLFGELLTGYSWWWNKHAETGKPLLTHIHPHTEWKVIEDEEWHSRDFSSINSEVDLSRPIKEQIYDLAMRVPMSAYKNAEKPINSISRISFGDENCLFTEGTRSKNVCFASDGLDLEDSVEVCWSHRVRESYNIMMCTDLQRCRVARNSRDCYGCDFIFDCWNCEYCFMSWNQRRKKYMFYNEQLTKEEWESRMEKIDLGDYETFERFFQEFFNKLSGEMIWPENFNIKAEDSIGEYLTNCVDCDHCWYGEGGKNCYWSGWVYLGSEDCVLGADPGSSRCFVNMITISSSDCRFCWVVTRCQNCEYCIECLDCENCFGCAGLKRKKFHIFNKEYSEEEYWKKLDEIKCAMVDSGEYGIPFYGKFSQTPIQHSGAHFFQDFPKEYYEKLSAVNFDPALDGAYGNWEGKKFHDVSEIPTHIKDVDDELKMKAFLDKEIDRPFKLFPQELAFYKKFGIRVPKRHFIARVEDLWSEMNLFDFGKRECEKCSKEITVAKNKKFPNRKLYCKECYLEYLESR